jgi:hypothetical protein
VRAKPNDVTSSLNKIQRNYQTVSIAFNVEYNAIITNDTGGTINSL